MNGLDQGRGGTLVHVTGRTRFMNGHLNVGGTVGQLFCLSLLGLQNSLREFSARVFGELNSLRGDFTGDYPMRGVEIEHVEQIELDQLRIIFLRHLIVTQFAAPDLDGREAVQ